VELREGIVHVAGPGTRVHVWGVPYLPRDLAMPVDIHGLRAPVRRGDGRRVDQVLSGSGWLGRTLPSV
jgi:hypothetical protein